MAYNPKMSNKKGQVISYSVHMYRRSCSVNLDYELCLFVFVLELDNRVVHNYEEEVDDDDDDEDDHDDDDYDNDDYDDYDYSYVDDDDGDENDDDNHDSFQHTLQFIQLFRFLLFYSNSFSTVSMSTDNH